MTMYVINTAQFLRPDIWPIDRIVLQPYRVIEHPLSHPTVSYERELHYVYDARPEILLWIWSSGYRNWGLIGLDYTDCRTPYFTHDT